MNPVADFLFFYPIGLIIVWVKHRGKKSFKLLIKEHEAYEFKVEAVSLFLKIIAGLGALFMFSIVLFMIAYLIWKGILKLLS
jgi:hypothetical protein